VIERGNPQREDTADERGGVGEGIWEIERKEGG